MKKQLFIFALALIALASCNTREQVAYLQNAAPDSLIVAQGRKALPLVAGDRIGVIVTSSTTPELAARYNLNPGGSSYSSQVNQENMRYLIDENGCVDLLGVGRVQVAGLTRSEAAKKIQDLFRAGILNDAVVTVGAYGQTVTVLGDVKNPGQISIDKDNITIFEAIGKVGDLNITGRRDCVKVFRQEGGETKTYFVDLRSSDVFNSPVYNLKQNDIVYVEPNKVKMGQSKNNDNSLRTLTTWLSILSTLTSISILIFR